MAAKKSSKKAAPGPTPVKTVWVVLSIAVIAAVAIAAALVLERQSSYEHNGFVFEKTRCSDETCWQTQVVTNIGVHPIVFHYGPRDVEDVAVSPTAVARVLNMTTTKNSSIVIAFDEGVPGEVGVAAAQIARITGDRFYQVPTSGSVYGAPTTCADASATRTIIYLRQGPMNAVVLDDGCVHVIAEDAEHVLLVADAFGLHLLRIM